MREEVCHRQGGVDSGSSSVEAASLQSLHACTLPVCVCLQISPFHKDQSHCTRGPSYSSTTSFLTAELIASVSGLRSGGTGVRGPNLMNFGRI